MQLRFEDRREAGQHLAGRLSRYASEDVLVLGLPRGGVPVAYEVAKKLNAPLDIFTVRKLGVPGHEEYAMGAIATGGVRVLNDATLQELGIAQAAIDGAIEEEQKELERRETLYRRDRPAPALEGRTVLLVDDGMATGASMAAAIKALRQHNPARVIVAVPAASRTVCEQFEDLVDEVICAITPEPFMSVGVWYEQFEQTSDEEVQQLLDEAEAFGGARKAS